MWRGYYTRNNLPKYITENIKRYDKSELLKFSLPDLKRLKQHIKKMLRYFEQYYLLKYHRPVTDEEKEEAILLYQYNKTLTEVKETTKKKRDTLLEEKRILKKKIYEFEKEFAKQNNRNIQSKSDIEPIKEDYERYKEIKKELQNIQPDFESSNKSIKSNFSL